jgi:ElaB/YqjD/DUF883 family membrane-anchored ribosome-binding protein
MFSFPKAPHTGNGLHAISASTAGELVEGAREYLDQAGEEAKKRFGDVEELVKTWVRTRPGLTLGAALAAGVVIGWLIKRRS